MHVERCLHDVSLYLKDVFGFQLIIYINSGLQDFNLIIIFLGTTYCIYVGLFWQEHTLAQLEGRCLT